MKTWKQHLPELRWIQEADGTMNLCQQWVQRAHVPSMHGENYTGVSNVISDEWRAIPIVKEEELL